MYKINKMMINFDNGTLKRLYSAFCENVGKGRFPTAFFILLH